MTTFSPLTTTDHAIVRLHVHGLDEVSRQLAPFIQVRYVQLQRGGACFHGAIKKLGSTVIASAGADLDKVEFIDVPPGRTLVVVPTRGLARLGTVSVTPGHAMVAHGPSQLIAFTNCEFRMLLAAMPDYWTGRPANQPSEIRRAVGCGARVGVLPLSEAECRMFHRLAHEGLHQESTEASVCSPVSTLPRLESALVNLCDSWLRDFKGRGPAAIGSAARCHAAIRARQYIDEHLDQALTIASVCHASYSSLRSLEYGFQEIFGISPKAYIRCARLSRVRAELGLSTQVHGRVTQLAMKWGFWHMSRFSSDYYELFGELPSTTLGRVAARRDRPESIDCESVRPMRNDRAADSMDARGLARVHLTSLASGANFVALPTLST